MSAPETPKFSGPHRRHGRPFGEHSNFHAVAAMVLVLLILLAVITLVFMNGQPH